MLAVEEQVIRAAAPLQYCVGVAVNADDARGALRGGNVMNYSPVGPLNQGKPLAVERLEGGWPYGVDERDELCLLRRSARASENKISIGSNPFSRHKVEIL
jgi:hypothetical protein